MLMFYIFIGVGPKLQCLQTTTQWCMLIYRHQDIIDLISLYPQNTRWGVPHVYVQGGHI